MTFTVIREGGKHQEGFRAKTETLHIEDWYRKSVSQNRLDSERDGLWDMYGDIVADENGTLYIAEKDFRSEEHFGEYSMWAEVEYAEKIKD